MLKKVYKYVSTHGIILMLIGFGIGVISAMSFVYFQQHYYGSSYSKIAFGWAIAGLVIYILGRFFVATNRRRKRPVTTRNDETDRKDKE